MLKLVLAYLLVLTFSFSTSAQIASDLEEKTLIKNLHEIHKGQLFRSAQLDGDDIEKLIKTKNIKTIINLRGENPNEEWYQDEKNAADRYGVKLINFSMSAKRLPHRKDLVGLLDAFKTAERPILIHCKAGVDRTGEAAAIYQMIYQGKSKKEALKMLSPKYFHFEQFKPAKRYFIRDVWQSQDWAYNNYDPCLANYKYYDKKHCNQ